MVNLEKEINLLLEEKSAEHIAVRVGRGDEILYETFRGANSETLFDMASVTKIMVTTSLCLIAMDRGLLSVEDNVSDFFETNKPLKIKNLLTHTIGFGYKELFAKYEDNQNIAEKILQIPEDIPINSDVIYSCPAFILLGKILEKVFDMPLDKAFDTIVAKKLDLKSTCFNPRERDNIVNANLDEKMLGIVNDNNCRFLGGVAGNAGLFSNISDITKYVKMVLNCGYPLFNKETFEMAVKNYTVKMKESRALGFLYVDDRYKQTGKLFSGGAIGHCGHTGQSVFMDYRSGLYVIILSDFTLSTIKKYGREAYDEVKKARERLHNAILSDLKE